MEVGDENTWFTECLRFSGLSIEKAHRELGYQPRTLEEGIKQMFGW